MREKITSSVPNYFLHLFGGKRCFPAPRGPLSPLSPPSLPRTSWGEREGKSLQRGGGSISGLCTLPGAGWKDGEAAGSAVALLSACAWSLASQPKPKAFRSAACVRERKASHPCAGLLERGAAGGGKGEQMEGLEEHRVAAVSLGHGDPDRRLCEEEQGLARWLDGARVGARPTTP